MIKIAIINQKGGVGKTTTSLNLAAQAAIRQKTLLVDCDKQANLSENLEITEPKTTVKDAFLGRDFEAVNVRNNLDLIASSSALIGIESILKEKLNRERCLANSLKKIEKNYKYCFLDCPPDIGLITINALSCADYVILPVRAEQYSLKGIETMLQFVSEIRDNINPQLTILGVVLIAFDERLNISKNVIKKIQENGWIVAMFESVIRKNTAIPQSQFSHKTIFEYDKNSNGARDYMKLGKEVFNKIQKLQK